MEPQITSSPKLKQLFRRHKNLIVGIAAFLITITASWVIMSLVDNSTQQPQKEAPKAVTHDRPGYDRASLPVAISDPFALKLVPAAQAISYKGTPIIQACNLVPIEELLSRNLLLESNIDRPTVTRTIYDGVGTVGFEAFKQISFVGGEYSANSCRYNLEVPAGLDDVGLTTFQPATHSETKLLDYLNSLYEPAGSLEGFNLHKPKPSSFSTSNKKSDYFAHKPGSGGFGLRVVKKDGQEALAQDLLRVAAKNFNKELGAPSGIGQITFESPLFNKSTFSACEAITNDDLRAFTGRDAGPLARQEIQGYIANATSQGNPSEDFYTSNTCGRQTVTDSLVNDVELKLTIYTFLDEDKAKHWAKNSTRLYWQELPEINGGLSYNDNIANLYFSKGRAMFILTSSGKNAPVHDRAEAERSMVPVAKAIMNRSDYK